jgi:hypothetical protein
MNPLSMGVLCFVCLFATVARADAELVVSPGLPAEDRIRLAEAFRLASAVQDRVWPRWSSAPFAVILVTPETEFLVRHPSPTPDFQGGEYDSLLQSRVWWRKRVFPANLKATFPAVGGVSTIVIGQPANVRPKQNSTRWVLTVLHEHFHQWQETPPGYAAAVTALDLARGDSTGMWMLNYPFPYSDSTVARGFDELARLRLVALDARGTPAFSSAYSAFSDARKSLNARLAPDDRRYLEFQLWKEGVARYTEIAVGREAARRHRPSPGYASLSDATSFSDEAKNVLDETRKELTSLGMSDAQRVVFYANGAADALLLDEARPGWHETYAGEPLTLERLLAGADRAKKR